MDLTDVDREALGVALNEAALLGVEFDPGGRRAAATFRVLTLPADGGPMPADARVQFVFAPVGRVAAALRGGGGTTRTRRSSRSRRASSWPSWRASAACRCTGGSSSTSPSASWPSGARA